MKRVAVVLVLITGACDPSRPTYQGGKVTCTPVLDEQARYVSAVSCSEHHCRPTFTQLGCDFSLSFEGCDKSTLIARVAEDGTMDFEPSASFGECVAQVDGGLSLSCARDQELCRIDIVPELGPRALDVASVDVHDVAFRAPQDPDADLLDNDDPVDGYAVSVLRVGDRIVVSTHGGRARTTRCSSAVPAELVFVDRETMTMTSTRGPDCLTFLAADPTGSGFVGLFQTDQPRVGRFDEAGRLVADAVVPVTPDPNGTRPSAFVADAARGLLFAAYDHQDEDPIVRIDAATLQATDSTTEISGRVRAMLIGDGQLVLTERTEGLVHTLDRDTLEVLRSVPLVSAARPSDDAGDLYWADGENRLYASATGNEPVLWSIDGPLLPGEAPRFLVDPNVGGTIWGFTSALDTDSVWAFAVTKGPAHDAWLLELDPDGPRFVARATSIGRGVATAVLDDGDTRWVLLGWSAELLRIRSE